MLETKTRIIPLECDRVFKAIMSDPKHINILTKFLSDYLNISYEKLVGKVEVQNPEIPLTNVNLKRRTADIIVKIESENIIANIEINLHNKNINTVRNFLYLNDLYTIRYKINNTYEDIGMLIQINFSNYNINKRCLQETFYIQDEEGNKYIENYRIDNINIELVQETCYNKVNKTNLEKWCLLLKAVELEEFDNLLEDVDMEDKERLKESIFELSQDEKLLVYYDEEKDKEKRFRTGLACARTEGIKEGFEQGQEVGITQRNKEIALNMLKNQIDKGIISKCTNLSISEIEKLG